MDAISRCIVRHAHAVAQEIDARAVLIYADAFAGDRELQSLLQTVDFRAILITRSTDFPLHLADGQACA